VVELKPDISQYSIPELDLEQMDQSKQEIELEQIIENRDTSSIDLNKLPELPDTDEENPMMEEHFQTYDPREENLDTLNNMRIAFGSE